MKKTLTIAMLACLLMACKPEASTTATGSDFKLPAVDDVVMYQVNPRVFAPENSLKVVAQRADSISQLGVNVMWVMPIYPIGKVKSKNSPYSISDYKAVNEEFGTIDDVKALADSCHAHGMALILDWVANHTAWDNVWMKDHKDWYTTDSVTGDIIYPPGTDWTDVADLNYDNRDMRAAMIDAMKFWVTEVGVDGFRCDVADQVPADFWKDAIDQLRQAAGNRDILMLAEGAKPENFDGGFDMNYAWGFMHALDSVFCRDGKASFLIDTDKKEYGEIPAGKKKLRFITNHDEATKYSTVQQFGSIDGALAAFVATTFLHGGMLVYGSQEVAYPEKINFFHYVPVDWTSHPEVTDIYKKLIKIYNENSAIRSGELKAFPDDNVLAFERSDDNGTLLVLVNTRNSEQTLKALPHEWQNTEVTNLESGVKQKLETAITLKPFQYLILKK